MGHQERDVSMAETVVKPPEQQTKEELAVSIAAEEARLAAENTQSKPEEKQRFEYKATDGTIYEAESQEELLKKVTAALDNTKLAMRDRERQIHELRTQKPVEKPADEKKDTFDREKWLQLMESGPDGPLKAQDYVDSFRKPEWAQKAEEREQAVKATEVLQTEILKFYGSAAGQQYAKIETPELNQKLLQYMNDQGMERTVANFKAAFYELKDAGELSVAPEKTKEKPKAPPRSPSGGGRDNPSGELSNAELYAMPKDKLIEYMRSKGMDVYVQR